MLKERSCSFTNFIGLIIAIAVSMYLFIPCAYADDTNIDMQEVTAGGMTFSVPADLILDEEAAEANTDSYGTLYYNSDSIGLMVYYQTNGYLFNIGYLATEKISMTALFGVEELSYSGSAVYASDNTYYHATSFSIEDEESPYIAAIITAYDGEMIYFILFVNHDPDVFSTSDLLESIIFDSNVATEDSAEEV